MTGLLAECVSYFAGLQAHEYERDQPGMRLGEFFDSVRGKWKTETPPPQVREQSVQPCHWPHSPSMAWGRSPMSTHRPPKHHWLGSDGWRQEFRLLSRFL